MVGHINRPRLLFTIILVMSSSIGRANAKAAYRDLDKLSSLNETEQSSNAVTKTDKKLLAAQQLYKASHRLKNISSELKLCVAILGDKMLHNENGMRLPEILQRLFYLPL